MNKPYRVDTRVKGRLPPQVVIDLYRLKDSLKYAPTKRTAARSQK